MTSSIIRYEHSEIHYLHAGKGSENIFCLHGYGETAASFKFLADGLPTDYSLIAIDLPFHGSTQWNEERAFTIDDLVLVIRAIFFAIQIEQERFILLGYSMGGRIAMSLVQHCPEKISKLILLAPDGINVNFWYWLSTQTRAGNRLFRYTMYHPGWFVRSLKAIDRLRLANKSIIKYTKLYMEDESIRDQLYKRWTCMRNFKPDLNTLRLIIRGRQLAVRMLYGKHDRLIISKKADKIRKGLESLCHVKIINAGHQLLQPRYTHVIINLLTD